MIIQPELDIWMILQHVHYYGHVRLWFRTKDWRQAFLQRIMANAGHVHVDTMVGFLL
jgi:hypothetical protein